MSENPILNQKIRIKKINFHQFLTPGETITFNANISFNFVQMESEQLILNCEYDVFSSENPIDLSITFLVYLKLSEDFEMDDEKFKQIASSDTVIDALDKKIVMISSFIGIDLPLVSKAKDESDL